MSNEEDNNFMFDVDPSTDFEEAGYELAGVIEFYEHPEEGLGAYKSMMFETSLGSTIEEDDVYTDGQTLLLITQTLLEEYLNREVH